MSAVAVDTDRLGTDANLAAFGGSCGALGYHLERLSRGLIFRNDEGVGPASGCESAVGLIGPVGKDLGDRPEAKFFSLRNKEAPGKTVKEKSRIDSRDRFNDRRCRLVVLR